MKKHFVLICFSCLFYLVLFIEGCDKGTEKSDELEKSKKSQEIRASLDGDIVFINKNLEIEKAEAKAGGLKTMIGSQSVNIIGPKWSPAGTKVAFIKQKGDPLQVQNWFLSIVSAEGVEQHEWLMGPSDQMLIKAITWSPDGNIIAILTENKILYITAGTGEYTETSLLSGDESYRSIAWWPGGNKIAVSATKWSLGGSLSSIWLFKTYENNPPKSQENLLLSSAGSIEYMDWSRDGSKLAYSGSDYYSSIYVINSDGSDNMEIILMGLYKDEEVRGIFPCWSSNNEQIIYAGATGVKGSTLIPGLFVTDIFGSYKVNISIAGEFPDWF